MPVNWSAAVYDPLRPVAQGNAYANQIFDQAAQREAGQQYASGDFEGASRTVGARGDFKTAEALRGIPQQRANAVSDQKIKQATAQHDYLKQAVPLLGAIYAKAGPTGLNDAFQKMLPDIKSLGTDDATIGQITQAFQTNPEGTLKALGGVAQSTPHQVGKDLVFTDPVTNQEVSRIKGGQDAPSGFETAPGGGLQPIKGGPGDPNYIKQNAENRREVIINNPTAQPSGTDQALDDDTAHFMAEQAIAGDKSVFTNLGRGAQGAKNVVKVRNLMVQIAKDRGMSGKDAAAAAAEFTGLQAGERTLGTRGTAIKLAADEAETFANQALAASAAVPRGNFVPINRLLQFSESQISDPKIKKLYVATQALINARARAISPTGIPRVEDQAEGRKLLANADGPEAYKAAVDQMLLEVRTAKAAPGNVRSDMRSDFTGAGTPSVAPAPASAPAASGWKIERVQ